MLSRMVDTADGCDQAKSPPGSDQVEAGPPTSAAQDSKRCAALPCHVVRLPFGNDDDWLPRRSSCVARRHDHNIHDLFWTRPPATRRASRRPAGMRGNELASEIG